MRVLFLAYYFPPFGGGGSQRSLKFAKYLPESGVELQVIAGQETADDRWAPIDRKLSEEVHGKVEVRRVEVARPKGAAAAWWRFLGKLGLGGWFAGAWRRAALTEARSACERFRPDVVLITMSPFESAWVGARLKREFGIPWVADLRDPWALDEWRIYPSRWHRAGRRREMFRHLKTADRIIMNTPEAANRFRVAFPQLQSRVGCVTNGYDAEDFDEPLDTAARDHFEIVHSGALHTKAGLHQKSRAWLYRALGRSEPGVELLGRSHYYLMQALETWLEEEPRIAGKVRLRLIGSADEVDRSIVDSSPARGMVEITGYLSHVESLRAIRLADLLFLPMHKLPEGRRATIVPGKTYEYLATRVPVLAAVPDGDARDFLDEAGTGMRCVPDDVPAMLAVLKQQFAAWENGGAVRSVNGSSVGRFDRRVLSRELAEELSTVLDGQSN